MRGSSFAALVGDLLWDGQMSVQANELIHESFGKIPRAAAPKYHQIPNYQNIMVHCPISTSMIRYYH